MAEEEEKKADTISHDETEDGELEALFAEDGADAPPDNEDGDALDKLIAEAKSDMAETEAVFAEVDSLRSQVAELESTLTAANRHEDQLRQDGNALQEKLEWAQSELEATVHTLNEANMQLAQTMDEKSIAENTANERGVNILKLEEAITDERDKRKSVEVNLISAGEELDHERSRFHWWEAVISVGVTIVLGLMIYSVIVATTDISTTSDEVPVSAAIEETRRDREPSSTQTPTTQPAAKAPIKKRFGSGSSK